jgi:dTDP-4-dehydrorhamnose reductase
VRLLILGAGGQVGQALGARAGAAALTLARAACDITDRAAVAQALAAPGLSAVVNCAAYTAVDRAESERELAFAVNAEGAGIVGRAAAERGLPLVHLSTDYVYAGTGTAAYREDQPVAPVNVYGASKAAGDAAVAAGDPAHLILRVSWVFGVHGANFVKTMLRLGRDRRELRVVDDQKGGPTAAGDIAEAIMAMAGRCLQPGFAAWGIYHFAGRPSTSWYGFARAIFARAAGPAPRLVPIKSRDYPTPATRPLNSMLECGRIRCVFGIDRPDWRRSLSRVIADLAEPKT